MCLGILTGRSHALCISVACCSAIRWEFRASLLAGCVLSSGAFCWCDENPCSCGNLCACLLSLVALGSCMHLAFLLNTVFFYLRIRGVRQRKAKAKCVFESRAGHLRFFRVRADPCIPQTTPHCPLGFGEAGGPLGPSHIDALRFDSQNTNIC